MRGNSESIECPGLKLDYTAGVLPVTFVDSALDGLPSDFKKTVYANMGAIGKGAFDNYDAEKMHGLPLGVQVVGKRFEEEKVIEGMKVIEEALGKSGQSFVAKEF